MRYYLPPLFSFLFLLFLAAFALRLSRSKKSVLFALIAFLGALHNLDKALLTVVKDPHLALSISRWDHTFFVFIAPVFVHFTYAFLGKEEDGIVYFLYAFSFILSPFTQTGLYIKGVRRFFFGYFAQAGPLLILFFLVSFASFLYSMYLLIRAYRLGGKADRERIKFILIGFGIASFLSHGDVLLTLGFNYYPLGNFSFVPISLLFYGLFKYDILDVGFIRKGITYTLFTFIIAVLYFLVVFLLELIPFVKSSNPYAVAFFVTVLIVFVVEPLKGKLRDLIDRTFFKGRFLYTEVLEDLSKKLSTTLDLESAVSQVEETLRKVFNPDRVLVVAWDGERTVPQVGKSIEELIGDNHWEYRKVIRFGDEILGAILLGKKYGSYPYSRDEVRFLDLLSEQLSVVFKNGKSFKELQRMNRELEERVKERTREIVRLMEERERHYQMMLQSEALANIGRLAAGVAHEINNPITAVKSLIQLVLEDLEAGNVSDEAKEDLRFCLKELDRIQGIIRSLLDVSRGGLEEEIFPLHKAVENAIKVMEAAAKKKKMKIEAELLKDVYVKGSQSKISQVFINLISNAIDASKEGGVIKVVMEDLGDRVRVSVEDRGSGIPDHIRGKIFSPFFTTKPPGRGTGLGLYISYEIVRSMGGRIYFRSEEGMGSTFYVELPKEGGSSL